MGADPCESKVYLGYGMTFQVKDLYMAAVAWAKYTSTKTVLDVFSNRRNQSSPSALSNMDSVPPNEIMDMIKAEIRYIYLKETILEEKKIYSELAGEYQFPEHEVARIDTFLESYDLVLLANDAKEHEGGDFLPWAVSVPMPSQDPDDDAPGFYHLSSVTGWTDNPTAVAFEHFDTSVLAVATAETDKAFSRVRGDWNLQPESYPKFGKSVDEESVGKPRFMTVHTVSPPGRY